MRNRDRKSRSETTRSRRKMVFVAQKKEDRRLQTVFSEHLENDSKTARYFCRRTKRSLEWEHHSEEQGLEMNESERNT